MKTFNSILRRGIFWKGSVEGDNHMVAFNAPGYYYLPEICHRDHACRFFVDYGDECFGWGYKGRGPKQLALTMLVHTKAGFFRDGRYLKAFHSDECDLAIKHHVAFMEEVISKLPAKWELTGEFILDWLAKKEEAL